MLFVHCWDYVFDHALTLGFILRFEYFLEFLRDHPSHVQTIGACPSTATVRVRFHFDVIKMIECDNFIVDYSTRVSGRVLRLLQHRLVHYGWAHYLKATRLPVIFWIVRANYGPPRVQEWHIDFGDQSRDSGSLFRGCWWIDAWSINDAHREVIIELPVPRLRHRVLPIFVKHFHGELRHLRNRHIDPEHRLVQCVRRRRVIWLILVSELPGGQWELLWVGRVERHLMLRVSHLLALHLHHILLGQFKDFFSDLFAARVGQLLILITGLWATFRPHQLVHIAWLNHSSTLL